jgi:hypothetical protein
MKTKSRRKTMKLTPALPQKTNSADEIPKGLERLAGKTPAQLFAENGIPLEKAERFAGVFSVFGLDFGLPIPEFAKQASKQFWKNYVGNDFNPKESVEDFGVLSRLIEFFSKELAPLTPKTEIQKTAMTISQPILNLSGEATRDLPPEDAVKFHKGRVRGDIVIEKLNNHDYLKMVKRAPIYLMISSEWRKFEQFNNLGEAERWLRSGKIIGENVDSSEVRAIFRIVRLRYRGRGRPRKSENGCSNSDEIRICH